MEDYDKGVRVVEINCMTILKKCPWCLSDTKKSYIVWTDGWTGITDKGERVIVVGNSASALG